MKLLILKGNEILDYVDSLDKEVSDIRKNVLDLTWAMRGGVQYNDVMNMSRNERELIAKLSKENLETTQKVGIPYF